MDNLGLIGAISIVTAGQQMEFRRRRQEAITEELLDIVAGFQASR
jgi:F0F1-type ATP synthase gamma subunit